MFISLDLIYIKLQDILGPDAQAGCIEREARFLFGRHPDPQVERHFYRFDVGPEFIFIIKNGNNVLKAAVEQTGDAAGIRFLLVPVADDIGFLVYFLTTILAMLTWHLFEEKILQLKKYFNS